MNAINITADIINPPKPSDHFIMEKKNQVPSYINSHTFIPEIQVQWVVNVIVNVDLNPQNDQQ